MKYGNSGADYVSFESPDVNTLEAKRIQDVNAMKIKKKYQAHDKSFVTKYVLESFQIGYCICLPLFLLDKK